VGAGYEWMTSPNWTVRAEYLFYGFSNSTAHTLVFPGSATPPDGVNLSVGKFNINVFRVAVNYKFDWATFR